MKNYSFRSFLPASYGIMPKDILVYCRSFVFLHNYDDETNILEFEVEAK